jgi:hypothetical protein
VRKHHTKNKGDLGVLHAQADLGERGYALLRPLSEHESFDIVAYRRGDFWRVQVKYRAAKRGVVEVGLRSIWVDRHGTHVAPMDRRAIDVICVYCPDTRLCYYLNPRKVSATTVKLRLKPTKNGQNKGVLWADKFRVFPPL